MPILESERIEYEMQGIFVSDLVVVYQYKTNQTISQQCQNRFLGGHEKHVYNLLTSIHCVLFQLNLGKEKFDLYCQVLTVINCNCASICHVLFKLNLGKEKLDLCCQVLTIINSTCAQLSMKIERGLYSQDKGNRKNEND